ncbi:glycosyltransferase family 4 protein [Streptomyces shenzhenensis]
MRIVVVLPVFGPALPTGAFITTREYVRHLVAAGHDVQVVTTIREQAEPRVEDGVKVWPLRDWRRAVRTARPELLITHHGDRRAARIVSRMPRPGHVLMVHGMSENRELGDPEAVWFPSWACRLHYGHVRGRIVVLPPPIDPDHYRTRPGDLVTLSGSTVAKGADVLAAVAASMPDTRFLLVRAAGHTPDLHLPNVEVIDRADPREVYGRTRILLMPSTTESYGRAGVEAMLSGIPVIASPLPGMREAFGDAAAYVGREDTAQWVTEIRRLDDPEAYTAASAAARAHTDTLDYRANLEAFEGVCAHVRARRARAGVPTGVTRVTGARHG